MRTPSSIDLAPAPALTGRKPPRPFKFVLALLLLSPLAALATDVPKLLNYRCEWVPYINTNAADCRRCPPLFCRGTNCPPFIYCKRSPYRYFGPPYTNRFVAAVVTDSNVTVTATSADLNSITLPTDADVAAAHRTVLTQELQARGLYNSATQLVWFFQSAGPWAISYDACGAFSVMFNYGEKLSQGRAVTLVAAAADLDDGLPVSPLMLADVDLSQDLPPSPIACAPVPTLSEWGLIIFALLLLTTGSWLAMEARRTGNAPGDFLLAAAVRRPPFAAGVFGKVLAVILAAVAAGFSVVVAQTGSITPTDVTGTLVSAVLGAYWVHLMILSRKVSGSACRDGVGGG